MDRSESHMNVKLGKTDSRSPARAEPDVSYAELHFKTLSTPQVRTDRDGLTSTYSEMKFRKEEPRIDEDELPPISSEPGGMTATAQTVAKEQDAKVMIRNKTHRLICLLCLVTSALIVIVAGLSIHVSQIRQSQITSNRNYNELNSTFQSTLSALNSNLSDLRHQLAEMEAKYRSVNETKAKICELFTSRREQACSQDWIRNNDRCYFISTLKTSYGGAKNNCSNVDARLLEINSKEEENVILNALVHTDRTFWIGKCKDRKKDSSLMYKNDGGEAVCGTCSSENWRETCNGAHRFICEKRAHLFTDIPEKIQDLCQPSVDQT